MKKYCRLCRKKEERNQCGYGPKMWDKYSVNDANDDEIKKAAEDSGITSGDGGEGGMGESHVSNFSDAVIEGNKSGDNSLRDWFSKSRSSDGKPGWVQLGGKYAGKPCAKQPGQTTKPKCGSSKMKRNLSKDEEEAAFRRKNKQDPNPNRKGKAINVNTEETINERGDYWHPDPDKDRKLGGPGPNQRAREDRAASKPSSSSSISANAKPKLRPGESYMEYSKRMKTQLKKEEVEIKEEGKKDACYHKVKSRYSVWPSAYASGALVKCRKKGAKNWGNKTKKEEFSDWKSELSEKCWPGYEQKGMKTMFGKRYPNCVKKTKTKKEEIELSDAYGKTFAVIDDIIKPEPLKPSKNDIEYETYDIEAMTEATRIPAKTGNIIQVFLSWRGRMYVIKMFFPSVAQPSRSEVQDQLDKVYPGSKVQSYKISEIKPGEQFLQTEETELEEGSPAWQRKEGKSASGGLNAKGVASYRAANPGSKLKTAVTTKPSKLKKGSKASNRRKSFCSRMKGMKAKLTSAKTARDPDSRINKSLRKWNC